MIRCEYFYLIRHKASGKFYAGSSYKKTCNPDQFWKTYFTSSKIIQSIINDEGKDSFEICFISHRPNDDAKEFEANFLDLVNAAADSFWINKSNGYSKFYNPGGAPCSKETKDKISKSLRGRSLSDTHKLNLSMVGMGRTSPNKNKAMSDKQKLAISESSKGKIAWNKGQSHSIKSKELMSMRAKTFIPIICPHCNKSGNAGNMKRWHFDKCSSKELT